MSEYRPREAHPSDELTRVAAEALSKRRRCRITAERVIAYRHCWHLHEPDDRPPNATRSMGILPMS